MNDKEKNDVYYVCSLIEYIGRATKNKRKDVISKIGKEGIDKIFNLAEVYHCITFEEVSDEIIKEYDIKEGDFDNVSECKYEVPTFMAIGKVYMRIIEDALGNMKISEVIFDVFNSFISEEISNFNASTFYSSREYLFESYKAGYLLE